MAQTRHGMFRWTGLLIAGASFMSTAAATSIQVQQTYQFLDHVSPNVVGLTAGIRQQFGSTCVVLVGNPCAPQNAINATGTAISGVHVGFHLMGVGQLAKIDKAECCPASEEPGARSEIPLKNEPAGRPGSAVWAGFTGSPWGPSRPWRPRRPSAALRATRAQARRPAPRR